MPTDWDEDRPSRKPRSRGSDAPVTVRLDPADPAEGVRQAVSRWHAHRYPWPEGVPTGDRTVAWWQAMQEPFGPRLEQARMAPAADSYRTVYPYHDRLRDTLWAYLRGSSSLRRLVTAAREDGYWWRGESEATLMAVMAQTDRMREMGLDAYRAEALRDAARVSRRMQASPPGEVTDG
jgi:hypothetical protein